MSEFKVEQATMDDLEDLTILFNAYREFYGQETDLEGAHQFLFDRFEHRESVIFLVRDGKTHQALGFTQLYPSFSSISMKRSWILNDLFVGEAYRSQGVAQLLLDAAKHFAKQTHAKGIELSTATDNFKAQKIYERNGYVKDNEYYHYYLTV